MGVAKEIVSRILFVIINHDDLHFHDKVIIVMVSMQHLK